MSAVANGSFTVTWMIALSPGTTEDISNPVVAL